MWWLGDFLRLFYREEDMCATFDKIVTFHTLARNDYPPEASRAGYPLKVTQDIFIVRFPDKKVANPPVS